MALAGLTRPRRARAGRVPVTRHGSGPAQQLPPLGLPPPLPLPLRHQGPPAQAQVSEDLLTGLELEAGLRPSEEGTQQPGPTLVLLRRQGQQEKGLAFSSSTTQAEALSAARVLHPLLLGNKELNDPPDGDQRN